MLFSIIIATLNSEKTIAKTLDSISEQICNDFEVIIIDGLSEDNTLDIIINHKLNIRLITEKDSGIYDALNKGIKLALGDWIYIMGSDDIFYNQEVLSSVSRDLREDLGMVYGNILARNSNIEKLILMRHPDAYKKMGIFSPPIFHQSVFMRRSALEVTGLFPKFFKIHADHFLISYFFNVENVLYIDKIICIYNNQGFSGRTLNNYFLSTKEQLKINIFFGSNILKILYPLIKNFLMSIKGTFSMIYKNKIL